MATQRAKTKSPAGDGEKREWKITVEPGEQPGEALARKLNVPYNRHGLTACMFQGQMAKGLPEGDRPDMIDYALDLRTQGEAVAGGDLTLASQLLASQAITLDAIFTEMALRSGLNMHEYLDASERYMRLALKAQANSRATLEALAKLHQPREQTVRHVHVNEGGQAVIADQFHHHTGGRENGQTAEQPYAQSPRGPALPSPDPLGQAVSVASREGEPAVQDAWRKGQRGTYGQ